MFLGSELQKHWKTLENQKKIQKNPINPCEGPKKPKKTQLFRNLVGLRVAGQPHEP